MSNLNPDQEKREAIGRWAEGQGLPGLPTNLQGLPPNQMQNLFHLYVSVGNNPRHTIIGPIDYVDEDRRRLEAVRYVVQDGRMNEHGNGTVEISPETEEMCQQLREPQRIQYRRGSRPDISPKSQLAMRGGRRWKKDGTKL